MNLSSENGLRIKTKTVINKSNSKRLVTSYCRTSGGTYKAYTCPAKDAYAWYPLRFYLDYYYIYAFNDMMLMCDVEAPESMIKKVNSKRYHIKNFYDFDKCVPIEKGNFIMQDNLAKEKYFKDMGLTTWREPYNYKDVDRNFKIISNHLNLLEKDNILDCDNASILGMAFRMTNYMRKVIEGETVHDNTTAASVS